MGTENRRGSTSPCAEKGKEKRGPGCDRLKIKRGEVGGIGRGKMSFHMLWQLVRTSGQKNGSKKSLKSADHDKPEKCRRRTRSGSEGSNQAMKPNEGHSSEFSESLEELGSKLGLSWDAINKGGQSKREDRK